MAVFASAAPPNSFSSTACISGASGFLSTSTKFLPSGQAFVVPLHIFTRSASGTSPSLLFADATTAMFLIAGTALAEKAARAASAIAPRSSFLLEFPGIPTSPSHSILAVSFLSARAASNRYEQLKPVANQALRLDLSHTCPSEQFRRLLAAG